MVAGDEEPHILLHFPSLFLRLYPYHRIEIFDPPTINPSRKEKTFSFLNRPFLSAGSQVKGSDL